MAKKTAAPQLKPKGYSPENHDGKRYRVRDKDHGAMSKCIVWGDDMTHEAAERLKDIVTGRGKSRTARVEPLTVPAQDHWVQDDTEAGRQMFRDAVGTLFGDPTGELPITNLDAPGQLASDQTYQTVVPVHGELRSDAGLVTPTQSKAKDPALAAIHANILGQVRGTAQAAQQKADAHIGGDDLLDLDVVDAFDTIAEAERMGEALYVAWVAVKGGRVGERAPEGWAVETKVLETLPVQHVVLGWAELSESTRAGFQYEATALASGAEPRVAGAFALSIKETLEAAVAANTGDEINKIVHTLYEALVPKTPTPTEAPAS